MRDTFEIKFSSRCQNFHFYFVLRIFIKLLFIKLCFDKRIFI